MVIENPADPVSRMPSYLPAITGATRSVLPASWPQRYSLYNACRLIGEITNEMSVVVSGYVQHGRDRRRRLAHVRQIAMYVSHVCLQMQFKDIGRAFGRDEATVRYACHMVEDRRDDGAYDDFVSSIERMVASVFSAWEDGNHA